MDILIPQDNIQITQDKNYGAELCYTENNEASGQPVAKKFKICISTRGEE